MTGLRTARRPGSGLSPVLCAAAAVVICLAAPARSEPPGAAYDSVALRARVEDRVGRPVAGLRLRFDAELRGVARYASGQTGALVRREVRHAPTGADGVATILLRPSGFRGEPGRWFRGTVSLRVTSDDAARPMTPAADVPALEAVWKAPARVGSPPPPLLTLRVWEEPDRTVDGFPVWLGRDGRLDRVVVLLEGFDLYNRYSATDNLSLVGGAGDALRARGIDILVVSFPDSHQAPDTLAPVAARAIRAAARASGGPVAVAGLSAGGLAARWALVEAEQRGAPLPVHTLLCLDTPNRGANINPGLQAMVLRYGAAADRAALSSPAARVLLRRSVSDWRKEVRWRTVGLPLMNRQVPTEYPGNDAAHRAFFDRLRALNDRGGYPKQSRLVAVANSSRRGEGGRKDLLYLWLPFTYSWTLRAGADDRAPGSLLPSYYVNRLKTTLSFGIAGTYLRSAPTLVPSDSALDAGPDETPPFDAWYARPDYAPALAHDEVDPGAGAFIVRELLRAGWREGAPKPLAGARQEGKRSP